MADETRTAGPGSESVTSRLCDIVVIQAIRHWIANEPDQTVGWLAALRDPGIGNAIAAVHADASTPWTVDGLAAVAAMSRSAFSARFTALAGEPAMAYVTRWKMLVAHDLMTTDGLTVAAAGLRVGYSSEASFSRAFLRTIGTTPGKARRAAAS